MTYHGGMNQTTPQTNNHNRPLGKNQNGLLRAMQRRHSTYSAGCGWVWDTHRNTERILDTLVKRGLVDVSEVERRGQTFRVYRLNDAGRAYETEV